MACCCVLLCYTLCLICYHVNRGCDRTIIGGDRTIISGDRTIISGDRTIISGDRTIISGDPTIIGGDPTIIGKLISNYDEDGNKNSKKAIEYRSDDVIENEIFEIMGFVKTILKEQRPRRLLAKN